MFYGAGKLVCELLIQEYVATYEMPAMINRCGILAGPWQMVNVSDEFWAGSDLSYPRIHVLPERARPPTSHWTIFNGIFYVLRTMCQWEMLLRRWGLTQLRRQRQHQTQPEGA